MIIKIATLITITFVFALGGCARPYYGYTLAQWQGMSAEDQDKIKEEYAVIVRQKEAMASGDSREQATKAFTNRALGHTGPSRGGIQ